MIRICFLSFFFFIINIYKTLDALSLLLNLELFILMLLNIFRLLSKNRMLVLFGLSFFFIRIAVLAATIGLVTLRGLKKINESIIRRLSY